MRSNLLSQLTRRAWRIILLWLAPAIIGGVCFALDLQPSPHWAWDAAFLLLTILPLSAAIRIWIALRADLAAGLERIPCRVVRVDQRHLEVEILSGKRLLLR